MKELNIGGLTFAIEYRHTAEDRGPAIRVFGEVDSQRRQLLRFDCFEDDPHYHYDPTGKNQMFHLDPLTMGCAMEFSLDQIASRCEAMIRKAGFDQAADRVSQETIATRIGEIRDAIGSEQAAAASA